MFDVQTLGLLRIGIFSLRLRQSRECLAVAIITSLSSILRLVLRISAESVCRIVAQNARSSILGRMGWILGRFGTDVGTDKMCKIVNVYRPWFGGTDKLGGEKGYGPKSEARSQKFEGF
jgi:hypothetical protein